MTYHLPPTHPAFFDGYLLNTQNWTTGTNGVRLKKVEGWDDHADIRDARKPRNGQDGEYADTPKLGGRSLTLHGEISGATWTELQTNKRALLAALQLTDDERVFKMPLPSASSPSFTHSASMVDFERVNARVVDGVEFTETDSPLLETWTCAMRASDGRVFNDVATSTDSGTTGSGTRTLSVDQAGSRKTPWQITVTGPTAAAWNVASDSGIALATTSLALGSGQSVTFDSKARTALFTGDYRAARMAYGLTVLGLWMLDETTGTAADNYEGTAARDGTYTGGFTLNQTGFLAGRGAVQLNGSTGYVSVPYSAGLFPNNPNGIVCPEMWVYPTSASGTMTIIDNLSSNRGFRIELITGTTLRFTWGNGSTTFTLDAPVTGLVPLNTWTHIMVTNSVNQHGIYVNGSLINGVFTSGSTMLDQTSGGMRFGSSLAGTNWWTGRLGAIAMYAGGAAGNTPYALSQMRTDGSNLNVYGKLDPGVTKWDELGKDATNFSLAGASFGTGTKLNVTYRDARV